MLRSMSAGRFDRPIRNRLSRTGTGSPATGMPPQARGPGELRRRLGLCLARSWPVRRGVQAAFAGVSGSAASMARM